MPKKTVTIHQPQYLPWAPYFDKILQSDQFILLDNVQFQKNGLQNRNQIKTKTGAIWLTVPVRHHFGQTISQTNIADPKTVQKHFKTIEMSYKKSLYFDEVAAMMSAPLQAKTDKLIDLNCALIHTFLNYLDYKGEITLASAYDVPGHGSDLILNLCKRVEADVYLSGTGGRNYLNLAAFSKAGIEVVFQEYQQVEYPQLFLENGFAKGLSIVDLLFNVGRQSRDYIEKGRLN